MTRGPLNITDTQQAFVITSNTMTRLANATPYVSGYLVANSATAGSVVPFSFAGAVRTAGGVSRIDRIRIQKSGTSVTNAIFRVHFYRATVTPSNGDGAAWLTPISGYIGAMDVTVDRVFSDGADGAGVPLIGSGTIFTIPSGTTMYALLEARGAYTPASGETFTLIAEGYRF